jgi:16S rRNA (cytosine967-C5)-methyltransferase
VSDARGVAARVLARVEKDAAFATAALEAELERAAQLSPRDRALATELVYGTLRVLPWLLGRVDRHAPRGTGKLEPRVRAHLAIAAYQLFFTRVPAFAAVSEAVGAVRKARGERVGSFANAVLRRLAEEAAVIDDAARHDAVAASTPAWLREALARSLGDEAAQAFLACGPPPVALRVERATERDAWVARLSEALPAASFEPGQASPQAVLARGAGKPQKLPGWKEGAWSVQEEGAQLAAIALGAREGDEVLDACAGRGNKTAVLARAVGERGAVDACDASPTKLERLAEELSRLGLRARATHAVDWTVGPGDVGGRYDRVLVDAPCTGVGTLRRRPDIALRRAPDDLAALAERQVAITARAAGHVSPGGSLLYVVCSVLREECEDVTAQLMTRCPWLHPAPFDAPAARAIAGDASSFRLLPHVHGTDGYFLARFVRLEALTA